MYKLKLKEKLVMTPCENMKTNIKEAAEEENETISEKIVQMAKLSTKQCGNTKPIFHLSNT